MIRMNTGVIKIHFLVIFFNLWLTYIDSRNAANLLFAMLLTSSRFLTKIDLQIAFINGNVSHYLFIYTFKKWCQGEAL